MNKRRTMTVFAGRPRKRSGRVGKTGALRSVLLVGAAAIAPFAALSPTATAARAGALDVFAPSSRPMVLTRELRRPLPGGAEVSTSRSYEIRFLPDGAGYRIEGTLVDVEVHVPPAFKALAAMESARPDTGLFPMFVDAAGRFRPQPAAETSSFAREAARVAGTQVPATLGADEARDAQAFIAQIGSGQSRTPWPDDLFRPETGKRRDSHVVPLPGGKTGEVSIEIEAKADDASGLVTMLRRKVTTNLGGAARVTIETWTLEQKA